MNNKMTSDYGLQQLKLHEAVSEYKTQTISDFSLFDSDMFDDFDTDNFLHPIKIERSIYH